MEAGVSGLDGQNVQGHVVLGFLLRYESVTIPSPRTKADTVLGKRKR